MGEITYRKELWTLNDRKEWWERYSETVNKAYEKALEAYADCTGSEVSAAGTDGAVSSGRRMFSGSGQQVVFGMMGSGINKGSAALYSSGAYLSSRMQYGSGRISGSGRLAGSGPKTTGENGIRDFGVTGLGYGMWLI